jgi:GT2 family glycosyltransferase
MVSDLLASIARQGKGCIDRIIVVDNDSGDDSVARLRSQIASLEMAGRAVVLDATENAGFGAGNNLGAAWTCSSDAESDLYWFLNPDTLVEHIDLPKIFNWFQSEKNVGIVGTGMIDVAGKPDLAGRRFLSPLGEFVANAGAFGLLRRWSVADPSLDRPGPVDWVSGASLFIRTSVFEQLGGFDEGFFLYFEEVDLCRRARKEGWKVIYEPRSRIVHLEGSSTGVCGSKPMPTYWYESRRRYFVKHYGVIGLWAADLAWGLGRIVGMLRGRGPSACRWRNLWRCDWPVLMGEKKLACQHGRQ